MLLPQTLPCPLTFVRDFPTVTLTLGDIWSYSCTIRTESSVVALEKKVGVENKDHASAPERIKSLITHGTDSAFMG